MAARPRSTSARSSDSGFSQKMGLPAAAPATSRSTWVSVEEQMAMASTSSAPISSSGLAATRQSRAAAVSSADSAPHVVDPGEGEPGHPEGDQLGVHAADPTAAEDADAQRHGQTSPAAGLGESPAPTTDWSKSSEAPVIIPDSSESR